MGVVLDERRRESAHRLSALAANLADAEEILKNRACVYVTGSFGRGEASPYSDLDVFIVGRTIEESRGNSRTRDRALPRLDDICLKAALIRASRAAQFPDFSGDGRFLEHHTIADLVGELGSQRDDAQNTFTARLLLLLESKPLLGKPAYDHAIREVVAAYWRDFEDHRDSFDPTFLANDVLRLWRTFCVNYEASTSNEPDVKKAKRRAKRYKLKHSRLLTCYSTLLYLMALRNERGTVTLDDAVQMVSLTPTERVEFVLENESKPMAREHLARMLELYEGFLHESGVHEDDLHARVMNDSEYASLRRSAAEFGEAVFMALDALGQGTPFYRTLVV